MNINQQCNDKKNRRLHKQPHFESNITREKSHIVNTGEPLNYMQI